MKLFELEATLSLDTDKFTTGIRDANDAGKSLAKQFGADAESIKAAFNNAFSFSIGQMMADGFKFALGAGWEFVQESIDMAAAVQQTDEKLRQVFGEDGAELVSAWAKTTKESFGISEQSAKNYAADIAALWSNDLYDFTPEQLIEMSTRLVELIGDLASFNNFSVPVTWQKVLSGLRGETEAIEDLNGIDLRASAIAPFFNMDVSDWGKLDSRTRVLKTYEYLLSTTTKAQGDFARTSDTYQNQLATFMANIEELKGLIGEGLLPAANGLLTFMNTLFVDTSSTENAVDGLSESFVTTYAEIARTTDNALALINALERMENDGVDTAEEYEKWVSTLTDLQTLIPSVSSLVDEQTGSIAGGTAALRDHISAWKQDGAAMARLEIIKQYYTEVAQQEFATERALRNYQAATDANSGYMQVYNQLKSQAEKHLLKTYPEHYKTYADLYATQYGTQDTSGLLFQLGQHSRNDPAAKALLDSLNSTNQKLYEKQPTMQKNRSLTACMQK